MSHPHGSGRSEDLQELEGLSALERLRRTTELLEELRISRTILRSVRAKAAREVFRTMSKDEIAQELGVSSKGVHKILKSDRAPTS